MCVFIDHISSLRVILINAPFVDICLAGNGDIFSHADWASHRQLMRDNIRGEDWQVSYCTYTWIYSDLGAVVVPLIS